MLIVIENLRGPVERIVMVQMLKLIRMRQLSDCRLYISSTALDSESGYHLAGTVFLPCNFCDAMPSFPVFLEYWPTCWGTEKDMLNKAFVFNPEFIESVVHMDDKHFNPLITDILKPVDQKKYNPELPLFEVLS